MNPLEIFNQDEAMKSAVKQFMVETLEQMTIEMVFGGENPVGIPEARKTIDRMFDNMETLFKKEKKPLIESSR